MKALVTGGLGFIGSHTVDLLSKSPDTEVTIIDNMSTCCRYGSSLPPCCRLIPLDVAEPTFNFRALKKCYDVIYHYAGPVGPAGVLKHAGNMGSQIITGIRNMIKVALKHDAELIFVSTSEVYGFRTQAEPLKESSDKVLHGEYSVRNEYGQAKLLAEIMLANKAKVSPLRYHIFRPFNVCGPYQRPEGGFVLPRMVISALKGEDVTVFGDGKQIRSFIHVQDLVEGIEVVRKKGVKNQVWNLGNRNNTTNIRNLAISIVQLSKSKSKIVYVDPKTIWGPTYEEAWDKIADTTKASDLGWTATKGLNKIITETIEYWKPKCT